jgi:multidrug efflux pump subunit AcrB
LPFSISAAIGFIALFGIAILNGVVMGSYMEERRKEGLTAAAAWVAVGSAFLKPDIKENLAHEHSRHRPGQLVPATRVAYP